MSSEAKVFALNVDANIYMVVDERGNSLGTGTKEVCEALAKIATIKEALPDARPYQLRIGRSIGNIRSAITI